jgi:hypothetical protein
MAAWQATKWAQLLKNCLGFNGRAAAASSSLIAAPSLRIPHCCPLPAHPSLLPPPCAPPSHLTSSNWEPQVQVANASPAPPPPPPPPPPGPPPPPPAAIGAAPLKTMVATSWVRMLACKQLTDLLEWVGVGGRDWLVCGGGLLSGKGTPGTQPIARRESCWMGKETHSLPIPTLTSLASLAGKHATGKQSADREAKKLAGHAQAWPHLPLCVGKVLPEGVHGLLQHALLQAAGAACSTL